MTIDLPAGREVLHALVRTADVVVEGFRPGVANRIGAGYAELSALNPRLVYCALTGYGQDGVRAQDAGHDINYIGLSGVMAAIGPGDRRPYPPLNLIADFAGGGLVAAVGILAALLECRTSGRGQFIDAAMIDGSLSLMAMHLPLWRGAYWPGRGEGLLVGDKPFYRSYACADGKYVAVGALERGFFETLWTMLGLGTVPDHMAISSWPDIEAKLGVAFLGRSRDAWAAFFRGSDACVTPVLEPAEVWDEPHIRDRHPASGPQAVPAVPRLDRTPARAGAADFSDQTRAILSELGWDEARIAAALPGSSDEARTGLSWPPSLRP